MTDSVTSKEIVMQERMDEQFNNWWRALNKPVNQHEAFVAGYAAALLASGAAHHEPCRDAEAILEAYDAVWIEDERLADLKRAPPPAALKAYRERFNAARSAVLVAMRPSPPPGREQQAVASLHAAAVSFHEAYCSVCPDPSCSLGASLREIGL